MSQNANPIVTCSCCKTSFETYTEGAAVGCDAQIVETHVKGGYGSDHDLELLFIARPEGLPSSGEICDACIAACLEDGRLEQRGEEVIMGFPAALG